jgi:SAM-dependent methyltransferase
MNQSEWDAHYRSLSASGGKPPDPDPRVKELVERYAPHSGKRTLDLACGSGANGLWLAEQGWNVTAVDRSPAAIELVRSHAAARGLRVTTHVSDLEAHHFTIEPGAWDLILMCRYLQIDLFEPALLGLAPGSLLIVIVLLAGMENAPPQPFRVHAGELASHFGNRPGFRIVHQREAAHSPGDFLLTQAVAEIAVQRNRECE